MLRRRTWRVLLCVLLALVTTVLLALSVPVWVQPGAERKARVFARWDLPFACGEIRAPAHVTLGWVDLRAINQNGPTLQMLDDYRAAVGPKIRAAPGRRLIDTPPAWGSMAGSSPPAAQGGYDRGFGWPLVCLWYREVIPVNSRDWDTRLEGYWSLSGRTPARTRWDPVLPRWIVWRGLVVNTAVFAALWGALLYAPGTVRSWARFRHGACERCGYDLRGLPPGSPCPECGRDQMALPQEGATATPPA